MSNSNAILKAGALAYFDSFTGLIPCKVLRVFIEDKELSYSTLKLERVSFLVTADRSGYKRGETLESSIVRVAPRQAVRFRKYGTRILSYSHEVTSNV